MVVIVVLRFFLLLNLIFASNFDPFTHPFIFSKKVLLFLFFVRFESFEKRTDDVDKGRLNFLLNMYILRPIFLQKTNYFWWKQQQQSQKNWKKYFIQILFLAAILLLLLLSYLCSFHKLLQRGSERSTQTSKQLGIPHRPSLPREHNKNFVVCQSVKERLYYLFKWKMQKDLVAALPTN